MGIKDTIELLLQIEEVTDKYCKLEVKILRFTQHFLNDANLPLSNNAVNKNYADLPKIELPIFDGKLENWIPFSNIFKTTIIDNKTKIEILDRLRKGDRVVDVTKSYSMNEATIRTIRTNENTIRKSVAAGNTTGMGTTSYTRNIAMEKMEQTLKLKGELASGDVDAAQEYPAKFAEIINDNSYTPDQVFNADESGLFWKKMPEKTYVSKFYISASGHKAAKDRITIRFCSNASGDYIMKPLVINKSKMPRAFKGVNINNIPVYWRANKKAWVTAAMFTEWFHECFIPDAKKYSSSKGLPFKVLLLIDNAPGHPQDLEYENVKLMADKELSEDDLVNLVCESESDKSDEEELVPVTFTAKVIREGLALGRKLARPVASKQEQAGHTCHSMPHINEIVDKTTRASGYLLSLIKKAWGLECRRKLTLFKTIFRSTITYDQTIWFPFLSKKAKDKLNSLQYNILKHCIQAYTTTSSNCTNILKRIPKLTDYIESKILKSEKATIELSNRKEIANYNERKLQEYYDKTKNNFKRFPSPLKYENRSNQISTMFNSLQVMRLKTALSDTDNAGSRTYVYTRGLPSEFCARANSLEGVGGMRSAVLGCLIHAQWDLGLGIELANSSEQLHGFGEKCRPHQPYVDGHYHPLNSPISNA
ncbi:hypothetical protein LAZ67_18000960 [Cordylochernes scorpioides]|uniref:DDE-1 domain-containing protein n=1 Tax=Cordylochernes scorpioides TaxID=51811 RepID=A0ABY6LGS1_9ARAC|nr:hypothetical protein LAZ67_18000960 [Cordylochernes scorpioides]